MARKCDFPVFDADNHFYETKDAFTRHLPQKYKSAIQYVDIEGRTKIMVRGVLSDYIPNPTFDVVARPGAQEEYFKHGNPEGKSYRELIGEPMRSNLYVMPFHEDSVAKLIDTVGVDHVIFGSDFPHPEGLAEPCSYVDELPADLPDEDKAKIMGANMARLMRVDVPA